MHGIRIVLVVLYYVILVVMGWGVLVCYGVKWC